MTFPAVTYLRGEEGPGAVYAYRRGPDGHDELVTHLRGGG